MDIPLPDSPPPGADDEPLYMKAIMDDIPYPSDSPPKSKSIYTSSQFPHDIPLPPTDSSKYSPTQATAGGESPIFSDQQSESKKEQLKVLGMTQAKKRLMAFSMSKQQQQLLPKKITPVKPMVKTANSASGRQQPPLFIASIKEEETKMKEMLNNTLLHEKLKQVNNLTTNSPTQSAPTAIIKPLMSSSFKVDSFAPVAQAQSNITAIEKNSNLEVVSLIKNEFDEKQQLQDKQQDKRKSIRDRSKSRERERRRSRSRDRDRKRSRSKSRERNRDRDRERKRSRERDRKKPLISPEAKPLKTEIKAERMDTSTERKDKDREREKDKESKDKEKEKRDYEERKDRDRRERREKDRERDRIEQIKLDQRRREKDEKMLFERARIEREELIQRELDKVRKCRMPEDWVDFKEHQYSFEDIRKLREPKRERKRERNTSGNSYSSSRSRSPYKIPENLLSSPLTKSLYKETDITYVKINNSEGIKIDYPEFMVKYTKTKPSIQYGFTRFNYDGYYKSRDHILANEDPHIVDVMSEIINQKPTDKADQTPILQPNEWFASTEKSFCTDELSQKKIMISHLQYSDDDERAENSSSNSKKRPESSQKSKNISNTTTTNTTTSKRRKEKEPSENSSPTPTPPKESDQDQEPESAGSMDSLPSPLLKKYEKSESSNEEIYDDPEEEFILKKTIPKIDKKESKKKEESKSDSSEFEVSNISASKRKRKDKVSISSSTKKHKKRDKSLSSKESGGSDEEIKKKRKSKKDGKKNKKMSKSSSISDNEDQVQHQQVVEKDLKKSKKSKKKKNSKKKKVKDSSTSSTSSDEDQDQDQEVEDKMKKRKDKDRDDKKDKDKDKDDGKGKKDDRDRGGTSGGKGDRESRHDKKDKHRDRDRRSRSRSKDRGDKKSSTSRRGSGNDGRRRHSDIDFEQLISACEFDPEIKSILSESSDNVLKGLDDLLSIKKEKEDGQKSIQVAAAIYNPYSNESSSGSDENEHEHKNKSESRRQSISDFSELEFKPNKSQIKEISTSISTSVVSVSEEKPIEDAYAKEKFLHEKVQALLEACDFDEDIQSMLKSESSENVLKKINSVELLNIWDLAPKSKDSVFNDEMTNFQIKEALNSSGYGTEISKLSSDSSSSSSSSSSDSSTDSSSSSSDSSDSDSEDSDDSEESNSGSEHKIKTVITTVIDEKTDLNDGSSAYDLSFLDPTINCVQKIQTIESSSKSRDRDRDRGSRYYDDYENENEQDFYDHYNKRERVSHERMNGYYYDDYEYSGRRSHSHHHYRSTSSRRHHHDHDHHQDYYENDYPIDPIDPPAPVEHNNNRELEILPANDYDVRREEKENSPKRISLDDRINLALSSDLGLGGGLGGVPREQSFEKPKTPNFSQQNLKIPHYPALQGAFPGINQNQTTLSGEVLDPYPRPRMMPKWLIGRPPPLPPPTPVLVPIPSPLISTPEQQQQLKAKPILLQKTQSQQIVQLGNVIQVVPTAPAPTKDPQIVRQAMANKFKMPLGINKSNKIKPKTKRVKVKVKKETPPEEERADSPIVYVEKIMKPVEIPEKPPGKGILAPLEIRDKSSADIMKKSVKFKDGIEPGFGTSGSDGEGMSSPPAIKFEAFETENMVVVKKKKKLRKRVKVLKEEDTEIVDENEPPPLPPDEDYPYCNLTVLYQNVPDFAEVYVNAMLEKGIKLEIPEFEQSEVNSTPQLVHIEVDVN